MGEEPQMRGSGQGVIRVFGRKPVSSELVLSADPTPERQTDMGEPSIPIAVSPRKRVFGARKPTAEQPSEVVDNVGGVTASVDDVLPVTTIASDLITLDGSLSQSPLTDAGYDFIRLIGQSTVEATPQSEVLAATPKIVPEEESLPGDEATQVPELLAVAAPEVVVSTPFALFEEEPEEVVPEIQMESPMFQIAQAFAAQVRAQLGYAADSVASSSADEPRADDALAAEGTGESLWSATNPLDHGVTDELRHLLAEKEEEFHLLGYGKVSADDIWQYLCGLRKNRPTNLHDLVNAVLSLQPQAYMNYAMKKMYRPSTLEDFREML